MTHISPSPENSYLPEKSKESSLFSAKMTYMVFTITSICILVFSGESISATNYQGRAIESIRFEGLADIDRESLMPLKGQKLGDPYSPVKIKKSIKLLFLKERFSQIYVDVEEGHEGVILTYFLREKTWISQITIKGNRGIDDDDMLSALPFREGGEFEPALLPKAKASINNVYNQEGHFNVKVEIKVSKRGNATDLKIVVDEGQPCILKKIEFTGDIIFSDKKLIKEVDTKMGKPISLASLERDQKQLLEFYHESGYLEAEISEPKIIFDKKNRESRANYNIKAGPKIKIIIRGNKHLSYKKIRKLLKLPVGNIIDIEDVKGWEKDTIMNYISEGFPFIKVEGKLETGEDLKKITLHLDEGDRYFVGDIIFSGNKNIEEKILRERMSLTKGFFKRPFSESLLSEDIEKIRDLYIREGFSDPVIEKDVIFRRGTKKADIKIAVSEGLQLLIKDVVFEGVKLFNQDELVKISGLTLRGHLAPWVVKKATVRILEAYSKKGHIYTSVSSRESLAGDNNVDLLFNINEGPQVRRGKVILRGNRFTKDYVITRELTLKEGDLFDLEKILEDRQRVYKLGLFKGVKYEQANEGKREDRKDMVLDVNEKKAGAVELGLGYATDIGVRGSLELSYMNIGGAGRSARVRAEASPIDKSITLGYKEPWLFGRQMDGRVNLIHQKTEKDSYDLDKLGLVLGIDKQITDFLTVSLQYKIDENNYSDVEAGTTQEEGRETITTIGPLIIRDSRDDPFNPRKGSVNIFHYEFAEDNFFSDAEFHKFTAQSSWYKALSRRNTAALSVRAGYISLTGGTSSMPIDKRFFLGGRTTLRGYEHDSVGPENDSGSPIGGEKMFSLNAELRTKAVGNFGTLLFWDAGNVWGEKEGMDSSDIRKSVGAGIRYITPIGPVSLEYGHKIGRRKGESPGEWYFTIGNIF